MKEGVSGAIGFINGKSLELAKRWTTEDLTWQLQKWLAREVNIARNVQRSSENPAYWEGYADALADVLLVLEDLRRRGHEGQRP